jgi:hypothetical protein
MIYKFLKLSNLALLVLWMTVIQGQEIHQALNTSGGNATGAGGSATYSIGQLVYTTYTGTTGTVGQGVQQPYEISIVPGTEEIKYINLLIFAYPNPASDYLILKVDNFHEFNLTFQLYDVNGLLLETKKIENNESKIVMGNRVPGIYFLRVIKNENEIKNFKIIKNQ